MNTNRNQGTCDACRDDGGDDFATLYRRALATERTSRRRALAVAALGVVAGAWAAVGLLPEGGGQNVAASGCYWENFCKLTPTCPHLGRQKQICCEAGLCGYSGRTRCC